MTPPGVVVERSPCRVLAIDGAIRSVHPLEGERVVIGRLPDCGVRVTVAGVSRQHTVLTRDGAGWRFRDLDSCYMTELNGRGVDEAALVHADVLSPGGDQLKQPVALVYLERDD